MSKKKSNAAKPKSSLAKMITERDLASNLQRAVIRWLESHKCPPMVIGGVSVIQMPGDRELNFYVAVRVTGKKPVKP